MKSTRSIAGLFSIHILSSCAQPGTPELPKSQRGSEALQAMLSVSAAASSPAPMQEGSRLALASGEMSSLMVDPASGTWRWASFDTDRQPLIRPEESLLDWSRSYITQNARNLGLSADELVANADSYAEPLPGTAYVTFYRHYLGVPVRTAFVQCIFAKESGGWRLREISNNSFGSIKLAENTQPLLGLEDAIEKTGLNSAEMQQQSLVIQPRLGADGLYEFQYATQFVLNDKASGESFAVTMGNADRSILEASSNFANAKQELAVEIYKQSYVLKDQFYTPFSFVGVDNASADANGVIDAPNAQATLRLQSSKGTVISRTGGNTTAVYSLPVTFAATGKTQVTLTRADPAAINAYMGLVESDRMVRSFLTEQQLPLLSTGITAFVNVVGNRQTDGSSFCNAYFNGSTLTFFAQGTEGNTACANTALIKDVVHHEWGHAMDNQLGIMTNPQFGGKITDSTFSEGIGDIHANLVTSVPGLGLGFFLNNAKDFLRNAENNLTYPPAAGAASEIHTAGQIISGSFWDLRQNLVTIYGEDEGHKKAANFFYKHLLVTDRYIDSYQSVARLDDNDNNPATLSPNYCLINKAFAKHGLTGGVTEPASCTTSDQGLKVRVDTDLGDGRLQLLASSFGARSIAFCEGKGVVCNETSPGYLAFKPTTGAGDLVKGPKLFYNGFDEKNAKEASALTVKVESGKSYTVVSRNQDGVVIGSKTLKFNKRDVSTDLSARYR